MARPGQVSSDEQAFTQILDRLENEVGSIIRLVEMGRPRGFFPGTAPLWSMLRMVFPVAESIGALIRGHDSSVRNLREVLENEFESVRHGYAGKSAALALLYRHALTHQDELQSLQTVGRELGWVLTYGGDGALHLEITHHGPALWTLHFNTTTFYEDTVAVCRAARGRAWGGVVMQRYNAWLTCDLDAEQQNQGVRDAIAYIRGL
jgi:hypothetical protein